MIKNVVFDYGQVLIEFNTAYMTAQYVSDPEDAKLVEEVIFDRLYWDPLDRDGISDEELLADSFRRLPERLWEQAKQVYDNWFYHNPEIEGMSQLMRDLKAEGYHIFVLSNISKTFAAHAHEIPILRNAEHCILSGAHGLAKPQREIFELLCRECDILPQESIFIDDNPANIRAAEQFGIQGYLFDGDVAKLRDFFDLKKEN